MGEHMTRGASERPILCINTGSSSVKMAVFVLRQDDEHKIAEGAVERIGDARGRAWLRSGSKHLERDARCADHGAALRLAVAMFDEAGIGRPGVAAHRVVHGGPDHVVPTLVTAGLLASLRRLVPLAPLHLPAAILAMEAVGASWADLPQVACFDTAFHATLPEVARRLPLPDQFPEVRRYGFHGLSYEYVLSVLGTPLPDRLVVAHLGNGASLVAVKNGRAVDTTMGLTPTGGILMGTRSGDLDPGALLYLAREKGLSPEALEHLVDRESGLLAVAGTSDMKLLLERMDADSRARLAVDMFGYAVRKAIGAFVAALGGIDLLVFTGGIGEHAARVRAEACRGLEEIGIALDPAQNARSHEVISSASSRVGVRVVRTDEDLMLARHARRLMDELVVNGSAPAETRP